MPWSPKDAERHTKKASTPSSKKQWAAVADAVRAKTGNDGQAIRVANAAVKRGKSK